MIIIELITDIIELFLSIRSFPSDFQSPQLRKFCIIASIFFLLVTGCTITYFLIFA